MIENINFGKGIILFNEFNIKIDVSLNKQEYCLLEDLLQIGYKNNIILDLGWYPEFDINGYFVISLIKNYDWSNPLLKKNVSSIKDLKAELECVVEFINHLV